MDYESEEEQIEAIKDWLKKNGLSIVLVVVLGLGGSFGWRAWQDHSYQQAASASVVYQQMVNGLQQQAQTPGNKAAGELVVTSANGLIKGWPNSAYADYAHLALAKQAVLVGDYDKASKSLQAVVAKPATKALKYTASLRLAQVYLEADQLDKATALLDMSFPQAWQGRGLELKGDLLAQQQQIDAAKTAYDEAQSAYGNNRQAAERVNMKLNQLKADS